MKETNSFNQVYFFQIGLCRSEAFSDKESFDISILDEIDFWNDSFIAATIFENINADDKKMLELIPLIKTELKKGKTLVVVWEEGITLVSMNKNDLVKEAKDASKRFKAGEFRDDIQALEDGEEIGVWDDDNEITFLMQFDVDN